MDVFCFVLFLKGRINIKYLFLKWKGKNKKIIFLFRIKKNKYCVKKNNKMEQKGSENFLPGIDCHHSSEAYNPEFCKAAVRVIKKGQPCIVRQCHETVFQDGLGVIHWNRKQQRLTVNDYIPVVIPQTSPPLSESYAEIYSVVSNTYRKRLTEFAKQWTELRQRVESKYNTFLASRQIISDETVELQRQIEVLTQSLSQVKADLEAEKTTNLSLDSQLREEQAKLVAAKLELEQKLQEKVADLEDATENTAVCLQALRQLNLDSHEKLLPITTEMNNLIQLLNPQTAESAVRYDLPLPPDQPEEEEQQPMLEQPMLSESQIATQQSAELEEQERQTKLREMKIQQDKQEEQLLRMKGEQKVHVVVRIKCQITSGKEEPQRTMIAKKPAKFSTASRPVSALRGTYEASISNGKLQLQQVDIGEKKSEPPLKQVSGEEKKDESLFILKGEYSSYDDNADNQQCQKIKGDSLKDITAALKVSYEELERTYTFDAQKRKYFTAYANHQKWLTERKDSYLAKQNVEEGKKEIPSKEEEKEIPIEEWDKDWTAFAAANVKDNSPKLFANVKTYESVILKIEAATVKIGAEYISESIFRFISQQMYAAEALGNNPTQAQKEEMLIKTIAPAITIVAVGGSGSGKTTAAKSLFKYTLRTYLTAYEAFTMSSEKYVRFSEVAITSTDKDHSVIVIRNLPTIEPEFSYPSPYLNVNPWTDPEVVPSKWLPLGGNTPTDIIAKILDFDRITEKNRQTKPTPNNPAGSSRSIKVVSVSFEKTVNGGKIAKQVHFVDTAGYERYDRDEVSSFIQPLMEQKFTLNSEFKSNFGAKWGNEVAKYLNAGTAYEDRVLLEMKFIQDSLNYLGDCLQRFARSKNPDSFEDFEQGKSATLAKVATGKQVLKSQPNPAKWVSFLKFLPADAIVIVLGAFKQKVTAREADSAIETLNFLQKLV